MKKLLSLLLAFVFIFSFAACNNSEKAPVNSGDVSSVESDDASSETVNIHVGSEIVTPNDDSEVSGTEKPDVSSESPAPSSKPASSKPTSSKPATSSNPTPVNPTSSQKPAATSSKTPVKNECFGSDTSFRDNKVDIRAKHVYWENGYLCVEAYVINGCSVPVQNIAVRHLSVSTEEKGFIASGVFNNPGIPTIAPYYNRIHIFRFRPEDVIYANADLTDGVILTYQIGFDKVN